MSKTKYPPGRRDRYRKQRRRKALGKKLSAMTRQEFIKHASIEIEKNILLAKGYTSKQIRAAIHAARNSTNSEQSNG